MIQLFCPEKKDGMTYNLPFHDKVLSLNSISFGSIQFLVFDIDIQEHSLQEDKKNSIFVSIFMSFGISSFY